MSHELLTPMNEFWARRNGCGMLIYKRMGGVAQTEIHSKWRRVMLGMKRNHQPGIADA